MAIARYNNKGYIVVAGTDKYLYAYDVDGGRHWKSDVQYHTNSYGTILGIADFNNDGIPEVYTGNQVFSLTNGKKLCDGGTSKHSGILAQGAGHLSAVADMDGDGTLEIIAGRNIYKVNIANHNGTAGNSIDTIPGWQFSGEGNSTEDGVTQVVDIDNDGKMEVVVYSVKENWIVLYVWKPLPDGHSYNLGFIRLSQTMLPHGIPVIGNIDNDIYPEIIYVGNFGGVYMMTAKYDPSGSVGNKLAFGWVLSLMNDSGCTGIALFDFNRDGRNEIVYRNRAQLKILGYGSDTTPIEYAYFDKVQSGVLIESPVIADVDDDGQAEIVVTGWDGKINSVDGRYATAQNGYLRVFKTGGSPWAPARTVWNQYGYNANCVNKDLTIPQYMLEPAAMFPGSDGVSGTSDDVKPYNAYRLQQGMLNGYGVPVWPAPDAIPEQTVNTYVSNDTVSITVEISNMGDVAIGPPVYVTIYKDFVSDAAIIATDSLNELIRPGETGYVTVVIPDINLYLPFFNIIARINDNNGRFPYQPECDTGGSELTIRNPVFHRLMKKDAMLDSVQNNGYYSNPVSVLFNESIKYEITAINASSNAGKVVVVDTLPAYLNYVTGTAWPTVGFVNSRIMGMPARDVLKWTLTNVASMDTCRFRYEATPDNGVCVSQPLFINRAWITLSDKLIVETGNSTYHQGAGAGVVTFSTAYGGSIYNAEPQVLDYKTSARGGVLVVPNEGYVFSGWSHGDYISLRGEQIQARKGIMHYDTLTVFGKVEFTANFEPDEYPVYYYLNGGENADNNPSVYTVESGAITLEAPRKVGDVFVGWTGSNGEKPQETVTIPKGSTGELEFYANFLYSGREDVSRKEIRRDKIWSAGDELCVRTAGTGSIVRIYKMNGILYKQCTIIVNGVTKIKLEQGIYIVTLNNSAGRSIIIQ
jgi:uncharacterized repeat protein (TIGR02543 family)/uncharacterized repeat protein (TIGR01451 family)